MMMTNSPLSPLDNAATAGDTNSAECRRAPPGAGHSVHSWHSANAKNLIRNNVFIICVENTHMASLFDPVKLAHNFDPETSHEAAREQVRTGKAVRHAEIVLGLVKRRPGSTAVELYGLATDAERLDLREPQRVRQRLTDLLHYGLVRQGMTKICSIRETRMVTWEIT